MSNQDQSLITVNYLTASMMIREAFAAGNVPYLKGSPGTGKSRLYAEVAEQFGLLIIDLRLAQMEPVDLMGFPRINKDGTKAGYTPMEIFPLENDSLPEGYNGWLLLLDEVNQADRSTIKASYKLVLDRMVGEHKLHKRCFIAMAGNLDSDNAITEEMGTAMQSRVSPHMILEVNTEQWLAWANANKIDFRICSFLEFRPDLVHSFDPDHTDCTYPCPRTWELASRYINGRDLEAEEELAKGKNKTKPGLKHTHLPLLSGTVGSGAAIEFVAFTQLFTRLPSFAEIVSDPEHVQFDQQPDVMYAMTGLLAHRANKTNVAQILTFIKRLDGDFQALIIKNIRNRQPTLKHNKLFTDWMANNTGLIN